MEDLQTRIQKLLEKIDVTKKQQEIRLIEAQSTKLTFWQDHQHAAVQMKKLSDLQKEIADIKQVQLFLEEGKIQEAEELLGTLENLLFFTGPFDKDNALLAIHSGQGGVEAMDFAQMLFRMYTRYCERKGWTYETIEETPGEEAGLKSVTVAVNGNYAYGFLKWEAGVHRLVRQSPFNADKLRQTSFALVEVLPQIQNEQESGIKIKEDDLEWNFFRASSHGGQNVQKVSSAVRLRYKPTGIVVTAQSERYQGQNRENALKLLRGKLWIIQEEERKKQEQQLKGGYKTPGWGNQIRSYVLHPYHMVKDLRTTSETANTDAVLDGDLDQFIEEELRQLS